MRLANRADDFDWTPPHDVDSALFAVATHRGSIQYTEADEQLACCVCLSVIPCPSQCRIVAQISATAKPDVETKCFPTVQELLIIATKHSLMQLRQIYSDIEVDPYHGH